MFLAKKVTVCISLRNNCSVRALMYCVIDETKCIYRMPKINVQYLQIAIKYMAATFMLTGCILPDKRFLKSSTTFDLEMETMPVFLSIEK